MCGLFGFSGWDNVNVAKIKMLGLYNKTRGRDSCGYFFANKLKKGAYLKKEWDAFVEAEPIEGEGRLFIGHTRAGTVGSHSEENAHPFNVKDKLIIAHNGTLDNHWDLCNRHFIDHKDIHVDSLALGHLIEQEGFRILEEYRGYAALLLHRLSEPDTLYVYHGASRLYETDKDLTEERPMFWLKQKEGIYFSSMKNSLMAIRDRSIDEPVQLEHNRVFKITKGKFAKTKIVIRRDDVNIGLEKKTTYSKQNTQPYTSTPPKNNVPFNSAPSGSTTTTNTSNGTKNGVQQYLPDPRTTACVGNNSILSKLEDFVITKDIWLETKPPRCFDPELQEYQFLYWHKGRYYISDGREELAEGVLFVDKDGVIYEKKEPKVFEAYFYRGVMIRNEQSWKKLQEHLINKDVMGETLIDFANKNFSQFISKLAKYPVTNLETEAIGYTETVRKQWWKDYKPASGSTMPQWSDRNYIFGCGNLVNVKAEHKTDQVFMPKNHSGAHLWVNKKIFEVEEASKQIALQFKNGEHLSTGQEEIKGLVKYFDRTYNDFDEAFSECPSTVWEALGLYITELLSSSAYEPDQEEINENVYHFFEVAMNDNVTLRENMESGYPDPEVYLRDAYLNEISDDEETNNRTSILKALEKAPLIEDAEYEDVVTDKKKETTNTQKQEQTSDDKTIYLSKGIDGKFSVSTYPMQQSGYPTPAKIIDIQSSIKESMETASKTIQESQAEQESKNLIRYVQFLIRKAEKLKELPDSPFATNLSHRLTNISNLFTHELSRCGELHDKKELVKAVNEIKTSK